MRKLIIVFVTLSLLFTSCAPSAAPVQPPAEVSKLVKEASGGIVDGIYYDTAINIPPGGLYEDTTISIADNFSVSRESDIYEIPGRVYRIEGPIDEVFRRPVEIIIPYDTSSLPSNRSEDDIFPVMMIEGVWYRAEGYVDKDNNVVHAITLHNGDWSWAYDKTGEWVGEVVSFFRKETEMPDNLPGAYALLEQRENEFHKVWLEAEVRVDSTFSLEDLFDYYEDEIKGTIATTALTLSASTGLIVDMGGKAGVLYVSGVPSGVAVTGSAAVGLVGLEYIGFAGGVVFAVKLAKDNVVVWNEIFKLELAYQKLEEARAIVWALKHRDAFTISPEHEKALNDHYAALQISQTVSKPLELDFAVSAYEDPMQLVIMPVVSESDYSDLQVFKLALKKALEAADFEALDELIIPGSENEFALGAYGMGGEARSHKEALEEFWNLSPTTVDISERGENLYQTLDQSAPKWGDWVVLALWVDGSSPMFLYITQLNGRYFWNGILTIPCSQTPEGSLKFCQELGYEEKISGIAVDLADYDGFVSGITYALKFKDIDLFLDLLYNPWYVHGCASPGCGIGAIEKAREEGSEIFLGMQERHNLSEVEVTDRKGDISCFAVDPIYAQYTVTAPLDYGLCIGFAKMGDRYYVTDIWWEIQ